ncbi:unnamed protein product [Rotaria magnacalcarata]|uniref:Uncharacterized protein n=2 Tax=Rotaria magnacalcarata TaxID=392030 RepID=A0A814XQJ5_9BILA|nr:unnamed protein product [Rotaria magnacalcarata]CAF3819287.1 unnamed protein product [Rotaria magnacalcarata]
MVKPEIVIAPYILTNETVVNNNDTTPNFEVNDASNNSTPELVKHEIMILPYILTNETVVDNNDTTPNFEVNDASNNSTPELVKPEIVIAPYILTNETVVNNNDTTPNFEVNNISNNSAAEPVKPAIVIAPSILITKKPVDDKDKKRDFQVNNASNKSAAEPVKPAIVIAPYILITKKPVDDKDKKRHFQVNNASNKSEKSSEVESDILSVNLLEELEDPSADLTQINENLQFCARAMCPMIYCRNNLPAMPSQRICCPRCVTNAKCNVSECPTFKCHIYRIPANFSAHECCDHCALPSANGAGRTKIRKHFRGFRNGIYQYEQSSESQNHFSSRSSSSSAEGGSSSKQDSLRYIGCQAPPFENQPSHCNSRFMQLLAEVSARLRDEEYDDFSDISDSGGMLMYK